MEREITDTGAMVARVSRRHYISERGRSYSIIGYIADIAAHEEDNDASVMAVRADSSSSIDSGKAITIPTSEYYPTRYKMPDSSSERRSVIASSSPYTDAETAAREHRVIHRSDINSPSPKIYSPNHPGNEPANYITRIIRVTAYNAAGENPGPVAY